MLRIIVVYIIFWLMLSEKVSFEILIFGGLVCLLVYYFNRTNFQKRKFNTKKSIKNIKYWIKYFFILLKEIIFSNIHVAKIVLSKDMKISPQFTNIRTSIKGNNNRVILANSITLTPGTLTAQLDDDTLLVHCLEKEYVEDLSNSKFEKILEKVEEE